MASRKLTRDLPRTQTRDGAAFLRPIAESGLPYLFERSLKLVSGAIETDRFLASVTRRALGPRAHEALIDRFGASAWPVAVQSRIEDALVDCIAVHFGFEVAWGAIGHKVYFEYPLPAEAGASSDDRGLVHRAFKWRRGEGDRIVETHYLHVPHAARFVAERLAGEAAPAAADIVAQLAGLAAKRAPGAELALLSVSEPGNRRRSFDLQLYDAGLRVADAVFAVRAQAEALALRPEHIFEALAPIGGARLGHVAAGLDRDAALFVTLYFAPERR